MTKTKLNDILEQIKPASRPDWRVAVCADFVEFTRQTNFGLFLVRVWPQTDRVLVATRRVGESIERSASIGLTELQVLTLRAKRLWKGSGL